jgi:hypothetical protein
MSEIIERGAPLSTAKGATAKVPFLSVADGAKLSKVRCGGIGGDAGFPRANGDNFHPLRDFRTGGWGLASLHADGDAARVERMAERYGAPAARLAP